MEKARRSMIQVSGIKVEVFQLFDGEYVMSQSQVAGAVEKHHFQVARFLDEQWLEGRLDKDFKPHIFLIEGNLGRGGRGQIKTVPINLASEFWLQQASY